jgi:hypothetical protein
MPYSSNLKMDAKCPSKTMADFHWNTWPYIPEDRTFHSELKPRILNVM